MLATDLISYMILIRGAVSDALFERVYNYDKQFRLRIKTEGCIPLHFKHTCLYLQYMRKHPFLKLKS
jgi:hypothetical protein